MNKRKTGSQILDNVFCFQELPNVDCNVYCLENQIDKENYELMLIDTGNALSSDNLIDGMRALNLDPKRITKILITHEHLDHILGIYNIPEIVQIKPEIYAYGDTARAIRNAEESVIAPRMLGLGTEVFGITLIKKDVHELKNEEIIEFGKFRLKIIYTPGHSQGSMSLYEQSSKVLFPGDVVFCGGSFGRYDFPGGSLEKLRQSIKLLMNFDVKYLCPGHMHYSDQGNYEIKRSYSMISQF